MFRVTGQVWRHPGQGGWHFLTLPPELADEVRARSITKPFGSVSAHVTMEEVAWETSLFADTRSQSYLLPLKAEVRRLASITAGDTITLTLALADPAA